MKRKEVKISGMFEGADGTIIVSAVLAGIVAGIVDFQSLDVIPAGTLILVFTFLLGLKLPRLAWLWAILIGGMVPVVWAVAVTAGLPSEYPYFPSDVAESLIAIGPAIVGAYLGALTRHVSDHLREARVEAPHRNR